MKYQGVCIAVKDVNISKKFYQNIFGLEVFQDYGINVSFGGLSLQQDFDNIIGIPKEKMVEEPHNMELYFEETDLDSFAEKLRLRDDIRYIGEGLTEAEWGQRTLRFYDPDGHIIEVGEELKMVVKRFLDSGMTIEETSKRMDVSIADLRSLLAS